MTAIGRLLPSLLVTGSRNERPPFADQFRPILTLPAVDGVQGVAFPMPEM